MKKKVLRRLEKIPTCAHLRKNMGRSNNRSLQIQNKTRSQSSEIPLLKAISAVNILMMPGTGGCSKYMPLLANRLRIDEAEVRYAWLHRNEVLKEWDNCVTESQRSNFTKVWKHSFLYGWRGRKRHTIDYNIIDEVAAEWASRPFPEEKYSNVSSRFEIQSGSKMLQFILYRKTNLSKFTSDLLEQQLNSFLKKYRNEVQKLCPELETPKTMTNNNRISSHISSRPFKSDGFEYAIDELEKLMYASFSVLFDRFFVPDHLITKIGRGILTKSKLVWRSYVWKQVGNTRYINSFRKKFNLVTEVDATHPLYAYSVLIENVSVRLRRLHVPDVVVVSPSDPTPVTDINNNNFEDCHDSTEKDDRVLPLPALNPGSDGQHTKPSARKRNSCCRKRKHAKPHRKYWRDVVKIARLTDEPSFSYGHNEDIMSQISDLVSKSLIEELKSKGVLKSLFAILDEEMLQPTLDGHES
ncbi:unnamed protein product [Orchesella dallaii]|uniref:MADF domain-containing protein n=1 Tax=Orchesella dallaii TaxID=48710 RepID=A0ABP1R9N5_9HEXA